MGHAVGKGILIRGGREREKGVFLHTEQMLLDEQPPRVGIVGVTRHAHFSHLELLLVLVKLKGLCWCALAWRR